MNNKDKKYILKRKILAFGNSILFYAFRVIPINKNMIVVCSYEGKGGFGCNPKYIIEELHRRKPEIKIIWLINKEIYGEKEFPNYIIKKKNTTLIRTYYLTCSKIWIDNYRKPYGTKKRKGQFYINTWHGMSGFKSIGLWRGDAFSHIAYLVSKSDSEMVDYFLSDSKFTDEYFPRGLVYEGDFLKVGSPRCDILINHREEHRKHFCDRYNIDENDGLIMLAPTFREQVFGGERNVYSEEWSIDYERLAKNLLFKTKRKWHLIIRNHPQLQREPATVRKGIIDVTKEDDMNSILAGMDALITDYSSCAMDAAMMYIPVFIFADDIVRYKGERGAFTWELDENARRNVEMNKSLVKSINTTLPFTIAKNNDELEEDILSFSIDDYVQRIKKYEDDIGLVRDGKASEKVVDVIIERMVC